MSTTNLTSVSNIISPYTLEEFNTLLEENKPYTREFYKSITPSKTIKLEDITLEYLVDIKIYICSKHKLYLEGNTNSILGHFKVSTII